MGQASELELRLRRLGVAGTLAELVEPGPRRAMALDTLFRIVEDGVPSAADGAKPTKDGAESSAGDRGRVGLQELHCRAMALGLCGPQEEAIIDGAGPAVPRADALSVLQVAMELAEMQQFPPRLAPAEPPVIELIAKQGIDSVLSSACTLVPPDLAAQVNEAVSRGGRIDSTDAVRRLTATALKLERDAENQAANESETGPVERTLCGDHQLHTTALLMETAVQQIEDLERRSSQHGAQDFPDASDPIPATEFVGRAASDTARAAAEVDALLEKISRVASLIERLHDEELPQTDRDLSAK